MKTYLYVCFILMHKTYYVNDINFKMQYLKKRIPRLDT